MEEFGSWPHVCELPDYERHHLKCCFEEELRELKPYVEREIHESPVAKVIQVCLVVLEIAALFTGIWELLVWKYFEQLGSNCPIFRKQLAYAFTKFILRTYDKGISLVKSIAQRNWDLKNYKFLSEIDIIFIFKICFLTFCNDKIYCFDSVTPLVPNVYVHAVKTSRVDDMLMAKNALRDCTPLEGKTNVI
ncbi:hypothetical protein SLEP1_g4027 [Rubroshorea leprosula]|uniref:Uncharacterized protein n=1 Tax=Rubroshorea leprosula TaxID=152421 RepID=A0AAV5HVI3_9ROSI|nr:hypothetical protein SLEP1_g4027 [Rubroshorea leprosula]